MSAGDPDDPDTLVNPSGVAYPTTVQRFIRNHLVDSHSGYADPADLDDLRDALQAAIAADREHRPPATEPTQDELNRLSNIYYAGFGSGAATALMQAATDPELAQSVAMTLLRRFLEDPAVRLQVEDLARGMWDPATSDTPHRWTTITSYPTTPRNHRDD